MTARLLRLLAAAALLAIAAGPLAASERSSPTFEEEVDPDAGRHALQPSAREHATGSQAGRRKRRSLRQRHRVELRAARTGAIGQGIIPGTVGAERQAQPRPGVRRGHRIRSCCSGTKSLTVLNVLAPRDLPQRRRGRWRNLLPEPRMRARLQPADAPLAPDRDAAGRRAAVRRSQTRTMLSGHLVGRSPVHAGPLRADLPRRGPDASRRGGLRPAGARRRRRADVRRPATRPAAYMYPVAPGRGDRRSDAGELRGPRLRHGTTSSASRTPNNLGKPRPGQRRRGSAGGSRSWRRLATSRSRTMCRSSSTACKTVIGAVSPDARAGTPTTAVGYTRFDGRTWSGRQSRSRSSDTMTVRHARCASSRRWRRRN